MKAALKPISKLCLLGFLALGFAISTSASTDCLSGHVRRQLSKTSQASLSDDLFKREAADVGLSLGRLGYSDLVRKQIQENRPDIAQAILAIHNKKRNPYTTFAENQLPQKFYREPLKTYFKDRLAEPITLYRGIDESTLSTSFHGEKLLVWTSQDIKDAVSFATSRAERMLKQGEPHVLVVTIEVPRFLVYERSTWPVLRFEDIPDLKPFIRGVSKIKLNKKLADFVEKNPAMDEEILDFIRKSQSRSLIESGPQWIPGDQLGKLK